MLPTTATTRMAQHDKYEALSKKERDAVDAGTTTVRKALKKIGVRSAGDKSTPRRTRKAKVCKLVRECVKIANTRLLEMNVIKLRNKLEELLQLVK